jgi:hypothetical protein
MRVLLWGLVALFGLALAGEALNVHGSKDEHAAIRHAVRAPFADLHRRDPRALCEDFTPAVDAQLVAGRGSGCEAQVKRAFHLTAAAAEYVRWQERTPPEPLEVRNISWHDNHATAVSVYPGRPASRRRWRLDMLAHRWRIATPAKLEVRSDCQHHLFGTRGCVYVMSMRFAAR